VTTVQYDRFRPLVGDGQRDESARGFAGPVRASDRARRGLNVAVAAIGIVLTIPLMLLVAAAIRLTSRGPVLYRQTRVGVDRRHASASAGNCRRKGDVGGRPFTIYKFRTMYVRDESAARQVWASQDEARITPVGRILRKYRLDELPQLLNVLRGDMNLVGPRPEQPAIFADLMTQVERYGERQRVLPGITGLAQVRHHYDTSVDDVKRKVQFDLEYIDRASAAEDAKIMLLTVPVMMFKRGAL
jgi:lipopolysaccharide/colanic/teichoic acid biosynthesis glycosyltransferase